MAKCAFLGLGVMGAPMAGWLVKAGHDVAVWNRTQAKADDWGKSNAGMVAPTAGEAIKDAEFVMMCLGNDANVLSVFNPLEHLLAQNALVIDHTTASPELARELDERLRKTGRAFLDAPVSGGQAGAESGQLTIMIGGEQTNHDRAASVMDAYAKQMTLIGPAGSGQLAKCVNQICIAGVVQGLAEGLHFAARTGLDPAKVIDAISGGAAQSWQMVNRWKTMTDGQYEHGFAVDWMRKDLKIALDTAQANGARLPVAALVDQFYGDVQAMGGNRWDTSSLLARLEGASNDN